MGTKTISICSSFLVIVLVASLFSFFANQNNGFFAYAAEGDFIDVFATGDGLEKPFGLVFGPDENLYVVSQATDEVLRYDGDTGDFIDVFVTADPDGPVVPFALDFGPDGNLYVSSSATDEVLRYDGTTGAFIDVFASDNVDRPTFILFGPEDLYVMNTEVLKIRDCEVHCVLAYNGTTGEFLTFIDEFFASYMIFGPDTFLYISDPGEDLVRRYNLPARLDDFVTAGSGGLGEPHGLLFGLPPELNLYVASRATDEVLRYQGETGDFIDVFVTKGSGGLVAPYGLACGPDGNLYVSSTGTDNVLRYEAENTCPTDGGGGGGGSASSYLTKPTFGLDHKTGVVKVEGGFSANGKVFDVTDNWHTDFERQSILVGETNSFSAKASAPYGLKTVEFMFGIPQVGAAQEAEASIQVTINVRKDVVDVQVNQNDNFIDEASVSASARPSICKSGDAYKFCVIVIVTAIFREAPSNDVFALKGIDFSRRAHLTYLNEGFDITGDPLNPPETDYMPSGKDGLVQMVRFDKFENLWFVPDYINVDEFDNLWVSPNGITYTRNDVGSWFRLSPYTIENNDPSWNVMTRMHDEFYKIVEYENKRAIQIFDGSLLLKELPDYTPPIEHDPDASRKKTLEKLGWKQPDD